ncbi:hypothetical protein JX265_012492 [Neoarthrinium moseri]|uniref:BTB domain-containing protein n=1 Tax=Neoarthrinium moseri TaxID=1658444 RepID=A0A9Q0AIG0_9PEZI|nr:hypothetical protein JX265_012492 [Neoarthrinium moseri]
MAAQQRDRPSSYSTSTSVSLSARTYKQDGEGSGTARKRTWGGGLFKGPSKYGGNTASNSTARSSLSLTPSSPGGMAFSPHEITCQRLRDCIHQLRSAPSDVKHVDVTFNEYGKIAGEAGALCENLLLPQSSHQSQSILSPLDDSNEDQIVSSDISSVSTNGTRSSIHSRASLEQGYQSSVAFQPDLDLIHDWIDCLVKLLDTLHISLIGTYRECEPEASPAMVDQLFVDQRFRETAISRMRSVSKARAGSKEPVFFQKYEQRFRHYDQLKVDLIEMRRLLQNSESGILPNRVIREVTISQRGDAILEFANISPEGSLEDHPVLRFRVSSHMLVETSPIFARMFDSPSLLAAFSASNSVFPAPPSQYTCKDGAEVKLFRMPQLELNIKSSFEVLLHAAHLHNDLVPRDIEFDQFVAIAEVCMRYQCTSPLELSVEYRWLPQWMHKAIEDMPDGLLLISYAFGLRRLFTRMTKTAILNIVNDKDLESKPWPQNVKDRIWAVRRAKIEQVYACCNNILGEYLKCPPPALPIYEREGTTTTGLTPTMAPRCLKGSHSCDAACLGWLMMLFNELHILPQLMQSSSFSRRPPPPQRSLNQLVDCLRFVASPPNTHQGPCDFTPAFRAAMNDIYNSVSGFTLFSISGKHGWGLSKHKSLLPQHVLSIGTLLPDHNAARRTMEDVALRIMLHVDSLDQVYNVALVSKAFFEAFKSNETIIYRSLLQKTKNIIPERWTLSGASSKEEARSELKLLKEDNPEHEASRTVEHLNLMTSDNQRAHLEDFRGQIGSEDESTLAFNNEISDTESLVEIDNLGNEMNERDGKMTREEAERIMWPDHDHDKVVLRQAPAPESMHDGLAAAPTEKFRAGDPAFHQPEEKNLLTFENKNLSDDHYQRIGLSRPMGVETVDNVSRWI